MNEHDLAAWHDLVERERKLLIGRHVCVERRQSAVTTPGFPESGGLELGGHVDDELDVARKLSGR
jgi:hypothetical protein